MISFLAAFDLVLWVLRRVVFALAVVFAVIALVDWLVRTRRLNPFGGVARFFRNSVAPLMAPMERRIVRSGGLPSNAPWWTLAVVVIGGILFLSLLGFIRDQLAAAAYATAAGPWGIVRVLVGWAFGLIQLAILVRVLSSLFRMSPYSPWVRWSYVLSEPLLRPLRQVIPAIGMIDITPLIAWFLLAILQGFVMGALPR